MTTGDNIPVETLQFQAKVKTTKLESLPAFPVIKLVVEAHDSYHKISVVI